MRPTYHKSSLTAERLREVLRYDAETGAFVWLKKTSPQSRVYAGDLAGCEHKSSGYVVIWIDGRAYNAQVLAWLYVTGEWPNGLVDHRDTNKTNNAFANFRLSTNSQNKANGRKYAKCSDLPKGIYRCGHRFRAQIVKNYKHTHLGYFSTPEAAHAAYVAAAQVLHGDFARAA